MTLASGSRLGPYEIVGPIGAGGMGEVYKARDTRLGRTVAVKVLPAHLSASPAARERFEREAKLISQLSHPHICALYDVGREGDTEYLVMEYLEGETLSERLIRGPLPLELTLRCGIEMAQALDRAHRQGIVHRDLKPGNVLLGKSGLKLLDFGLARAMEPAAPVTGFSEVPTQQKALTAEGTILGTFQYMAPEQLEGKPIDARADIFALGATLFEMATGSKAFAGESQASLISAILRSDPPSVSSAVPLSPPALDRVVAGCLAKDPEERWQSAADVAKQLQWIAAGSGEAAVGAVRARRPPRREGFAWILTAVAAALVAFLLLRPSRVRPDLVRLTITPPTSQVFIDTVQFSPDGKRIVFTLRDDSGNTSLAVRALDSLEFRKLPGTENGRTPFWSPDGREIGFFVDGWVRRTSADGGPVQTIAPVALGIGGSWSAEGTVIFPKDFGSAIFSVPVGGGTPTPVTEIDGASGESAHLFPTFLPDGRHFVFMARNRDPEKSAIKLGSLDNRSSRTLFRSDSAVLYTQPGYLLFARDNALYARKFDLKRLELEGEDVPAIEGIRYGTEDNRLPAAATEDRLVYLRWPQRERLVWVDRKGRELGTLGDVGDYEDLRISPDGHRVAVSRRDLARGQNQDIWVLDAARGTGTRITTERSDEFDPAWFPSGDRIIYVADSEGPYDIYSRPADGGPPTALLQTKGDKVSPTVLPDGRFLFALLQGGNGNSARYLAPADGKAEVRRLSGTGPFSERQPHVSPDGSACAFESMETGLLEVFVAPIAEGPRRQVSVGGGRIPAWRRDGSELFYLARSGMLMAVRMKTSAGRIEVGDPQALFPLQPGNEGEIDVFRYPYDVAPDGQRFLVIRRAAEAEPSDAVVVTNWRSALRGRP